MEAITKDQLLKIINDIMNELQASYLYARSFEQGGGFTFDLGEPEDFVDDIFTRLSEEKK